MQIIRAKPLKAHNAVIYLSDIIEEPTMRRLVDLTEDQVKALDDLAHSEKRSRASLIRQAIDEYLAKNASLSIEKAFGLWKGKKIDGLTYQRKLRREW